MEPKPIVHFRYPTDEQLRLVDVYFLATKIICSLSTLNSDWSCRVGNFIQPITVTTQIWVVTRHQYGISALVSQTSPGGEASGSVAKCRLFSQAR